MMSSVEIQCICHLIKKHVEKSKLSDTTISSHITGIFVSVWLCGIFAVI